MDGESVLWSNCQCGRKGDVGMKKLLGSVAIYDLQRCVAECGDQGGWVNGGGALFQVVVV